MRLEISGGDLAALGLGESPQVGAVLEELRRRKLNGELDGRAAEIEAARELLRARDGSRHLPLLLPIVLVSLTLHELAHAWVAWRLGDPTAKDRAA